MVTVVLSLPKQIVFVVLGSPTNKGKTGAKLGKVIAFGVLALVTCRSKSAHELQTATDAVAKCWERSISARRWPSQKPRLRLNAHKSRRRPPSTTMVITTEPQQLQPKDSTMHRARRRTGTRKVPLMDTDLDPCKVASNTANPPRRLYRPDQTIEGD